jgi:ribonuclease E
MREATARLEVPEGMGVILRTAGRDRTKADLNRDLKVLLRLWDNVQEKESHEKAPALILKERDVVIRALRDYLTADVNEVVVDSDDAYDRAAEYMHLVMPRQKSVLTRYVERRPIFHHYRIEDQLDTLYAARVALPSGGSLVIEPTEALVAIDVNSGKQKHGGHEETALKTNLEAAAEVARQLRLRDLGGIVVIDFIDMLARRHQQQVEKALKQALKEDKARVKLGRISANGTLELTRQRLRSALETSVFHECAVCRGSGQVLNPASHALAALRQLRDRAAHGDLSGAEVHIERQAADILTTAKRKDVEALEGMHNIKITVVSDPYLVAGQESFSWELNPNAEPIDLPIPDFGPPEHIEAPKKTRRRRRRKRVAPAQESEQPSTAEPPEHPSSDNGSQPAAGRSGRGTCEDDQLDLGLPTFELFDVDTFRERERKEATIKSSNASKKKSSRRRRRSRRSKRPATDVIACAPLPLAEPPPEKGVGAFLKRLFGMRA